MSGEGIGGMAGVGSMMEPEILDARRGRRRHGMGWRCRRPSRPRSPWGRFQAPCVPALRPRPRLPASVLARADWPEYWDQATRQLRAVGLRTSTLRVYRQVLRRFRDFLRRRGAGARPGCATPALAREFLYGLVDHRRVSWSWTALHISALRTVFDKLAGTGLTEGIPTPKRPRRLHDVLDPDEVARLLKAAAASRDRLAILLLYGCGLRTSELCGLRWADVNLAAGTLLVRHAGGTPCSDAQRLLQGTRERRLSLPRRAVPLLQAECWLREASDPVLPGSRPGRPVSARTMERIVRRAAQRAGIAKEANCRTLRRSYIVDCLRDGMNIAELGENLGHRYLESTLAYERYLLPPPSLLRPLSSVLCPPPSGAPSGLSPSVSVLRSSGP